MSQVLLIDDERDFCQLMKGQMLRHHVSFQCAYSLQEGVQKLASDQPDVLLLDNHLPDGQGWKEAGKLQKEFPNMRIILISALDQPALGETGIGLQFTRIGKPLSFNDIQQYIA